MHTELSYTNATPNGTGYTLMDDGESVRTLTNTSRMVRLTVDVAAVRGQALNRTDAPLENGREATITVSKPQGAVTKVRLSPRGVAGTQSYTKC